MEFALLRRTLNGRIGRTGLAAALMAKSWISAAVAAGAAWAMKLALGRQHPLVAAATILLPYGLIYFAATYVARVEECAGTLRKLVRLRR